MEILDFYGELGLPFSLVSGENDGSMFRNYDSLFCCFYPSRILRN